MSTSPKYFVFASGLLFTSLLSLATARTNEK